jgi:hypothetical protein
VHSSCVWRWIAHGVTLKNGQIVRLEAARLSGRWLTTEPALQRFLAAQTPPNHNAPTLLIRTPRQRERAHQRAVRELDRIGI